LQSFSKSDNKIGDSVPLRFQIPLKSVAKVGNIIILANFTWIMFTTAEILLLENCTLCPRECKVNRFKNASGYCRTGAGVEVQCVTLHNGEEPAISGPQGICNVFFGGCNLRCVYCQNSEISQPADRGNWRINDLNNLLDAIEGVLTKGITALGFVSPSHVVPQVKAIIRELNKRGFYPVTVYNTNGYDKQDTIQSLDGIIDVYLPDYKYVNNHSSLTYSDVSDYPDVVLKAVKEMYYQMGSTLNTDENGQVERGLIIRHLVLPGQAEESRKVLQTIASEISTGVHLSLMSQYHPANEAKHFPGLNRPLYKEEYDSVVEEMNRLGFRNGWVQDLKSHSGYLPDFNKDDPFGE
jgi:putative pyruvate formate lyase activating enzyme